MNILQVSASDTVGGAAKIAWNLFQSYRTGGHQAWLAVGDKQSDDPNVLVMPNNACRASTPWLRVRTGNLFSSHERRTKRAGPVCRALAFCIGRTRRHLCIGLGHEDFDFPATWCLLDLPPSRPEILHCHNLHDPYFDLRVLPWLSRQLPVILTLHDAWLLSGHCAHSFDCDRWRTGCGDCPDLTTSPPIRRDATAYNWRRKQKIFADSRLFVATPCSWLMGKVEQSMLASALLDTKVIPNGVDLSVFHAGDRWEARRALGLPQEAKLLLSTAKGQGRSPWQDYQTMRDAVVLASESFRGQRVRLIVLGSEKPPERVGETEFLFVRQQKYESMALYYQAADIYLHPAKADTFPNTVLEALACGTPVVATAVGGIPEQVKGLRLPERGLSDGHLNRFGLDEATGILVPTRDPRAMARGMELLLEDKALRSRLGENAAHDVCERFGLNQQVESYLSWYEMIIEAKGWELGGRRPSPKDKMGLCKVS